MATKRSQQQAAADAKHAVRVSLKFNRVFDCEIIQWLNRQSSMQAAIKDALLYYIAAEKAGEV